MGSSPPLKLSVNEDGLMAETGLGIIFQWNWHIINPPNDELPQHGGIENNFFLMIDTYVGGIT